MKQAIIVERLDSIDARLNHLDKRFNNLDEWQALHVSNHHGPKSKAFLSLLSGTGGLILIGVISGLLRAFGVDLPF